MIDRTIYYWQHFQIALMLRQYGCCGHSQRLSENILQGGSEICQPLTLIPPRTESVQKQQELE